MEQFREKGSFSVVFPTSSLFSDEIPLRSLYCSLWRVSQVTDYDNWDHHENSQRDDDDDVNDSWGEFKSRFGDSREEKKRGEGNQVPISSSAQHPIGRSLFIHK